MNQTINISATATVATIDIEGTIGSVEQGEAVSTYQELKERLAQIEALETPVVVVNIRSVGGDVADALLIYEALLSLDAHITTRCYGYTASAATIIAQAANDGCREISDSALYLIHNSSCVAEGNATDLKQQAELLSKTDERIAAIYSAHSGKEVSFFRELMARNGGDGEWLTAEQALEAGLVDVIVKPNTSVVSSLVERVAQWLGLRPQKSETVTPPTARVNMSNRPLHCTSITLSEGQSAVKPSMTKAVEDPDIQGTALSANAEAYNRDVAAFR